MPMADTSPRVSVVVPLRDEEGTLEALYESVREVLEGARLSFELVLVDDGSDDESLAVMTMLARRDPRVRPIALRDRFGKAAALSTGFRVSRGRAVVTMDADLQDDATDIPRMLARLSDGYGVVSGWRRERKDTLLRRRASKIYNWATRRATGVQLRDFNCGMKAYDGDCAREIADMCYGERHRYLPVLASSKGYRSAEIAVSNHHRQQGRSRYGAERYLRAFVDLVAVAFATRYGRRPMHVFGGIAVAMAAVGALLGMTVAAAWLGFGSTLAAKPLLVVAALMWVGGLQTALMGIVAEMVTAQSSAAHVPYTAVIVASEDSEVPDTQSLKDALIVLPGERASEAGDPKHLLEADR